MYNNITSIDNLLEAWRSFIRCKKSKTDVQEFYFHLSDEITRLHDDLINDKYKHGKYQTFMVNDSKPRIIHKALVRDRVLHNAIYLILYPYFDKLFIYDSYSCRLGKGTHKAILRFHQFSRKSSGNFKRQCWVLQGDIVKFFASIDQEILMQILKTKIIDKKVLNLLHNIIISFESNQGYGKGLPLGNLTSQLFSNIYLNEFDNFVKKDLKQKYYVRYADDFIILADDYEDLVKIKSKIKNFLETKLKLLVKINNIKTIHSGVDFLGWVHFEKHYTLRTTTKRRMFKNINNLKYSSNKTVSQKQSTISSYRGMLKWGNGHKLSQKIETML